MSTVLFYLMAGFVVFLFALAAVGGLMALSMGWPCANPQCKNTLAHADYTSMYCHDCRGAHDPLSSLHSVRVARTNAAYSGDWSRVL